MANRQVGPVTSAISGSLAATMILAWILSQWFHVNVPNEIQAAISVLISLAAGYAVPRQGEGDHRA